MRLTRLTMLNVGPFVGEHVIDFTSLNDSGLFLIEGPTGAGKSTIIDAITFALFGQVAGADADKARIRSHRANPQEPTEVHLEFSARGRDYTLKRTPAYAVPGLKSNRAGSQTLIVQDGDTSTPYRAADDIGVQIKAALGGIGIEQFRRLVVLPQGEFSRLLTASSKDNNDILKPLLGDRTIEKVQELLRERARQASTERDAANAVIAAEALRVQTRASQAGVEVDDALCDSSTFPETRLALARDLIAQVEADADIARAQSADAGERVETLHEAATQAERIAGMAVELEVTARDVDDARSGLVSPWNTARTDALTERQSILQATRGELRPLCDWEAAAGARMAAVQQKAVAVEGAKSAYATADTAKSTLPAALADLRAQHVVATAAAALLTTAEVSAQSAKLAVAAARERDRLRGPLEEMQKQRRHALDRVSEAVEKQTQSNSILFDLQRAQIAQSAARLAAQLSTDEPCLVCGSTQHPAPAVSPGGDLVTDAQVQAAQDAVDGSQAAVEARRREDSAAQSALDAAASALADAEVAAGGGLLEDLLITQGKANRDLEEAQAAMHSAATLTDAIAAAEKDLHDASARLEEAATRLTSATTEHEALQGQQAREEADQASRLTELSTSLSLDGDTASELEQVVVHQIEVIARVLAAERARAEVLARLDGTEPPTGDPQTLQAEADQRRAEHHRQRNDALVATKRATDLTTALSDLRTHVADLDSAQTHHAIVVASTSTALHLAELATGGPSNNLHMPLSTYAIQLLFEAALDAASHHLLEMSSGQYSLELKEEVSRGLGGLEISVHDAWSGTRRDTQTLSGGERFYASLALAIGLADVVSAEVGGVQLDTLFIDEGFGSLDADTLTIVMDQLDRLKAHGRTIGIISHVTELKEHIHDRIEVRRDEQGHRSIHVTSALS